MLFHLDGSPVDRVPYARNFFEPLRARLTTEEFQAIVDEVNRRVEDGGSEIATAGWLPGSDWTGTPFEVIYTKAARRNYDIAARFFGLVVWFAFMERDDAWMSGRFELNGTALSSRTYFRKHA